MPIAVTLLIGAVVGLFVGPVLIKFTRHESSWRAGLDGFALLTAGGLAALHLLPEAVANGGLMAIGFAMTGAFLPWIIERGLTHTRTGITSLVLLFGLIPHAGLESAALAGVPPENALGIGAAVIAHRLPVGLIVYTTVQKQASGRLGWLAISLLAVATLVGFPAGEALAHIQSAPAMAWLQALVAGSLLHVVFTHRVQAPPAEDSNHRGFNEAAWGGVGALVGVGALALAQAGAHDHGHEGPAGLVMQTFTTLALHCAPALLCAYLLAGLMRIVFTPHASSWLQGVNPFYGGAKGIAYGLLHPTCSHSLPRQSTALMQQGVRPGAVLALVITTALLGFDTLLLSIPLLGLELTALRIVAACLLALIVAVLFGAWRPVTKPSSPPTASPPIPPVRQRFQSASRYALVELVDHTMPWFLVGLLLAAWIEPLLGHDIVGQVPPIAQVALLSLLGILIHLGAAGATPLAAMAIHKGVSPGAALAFVLTGPVFHSAAMKRLADGYGSTTRIALGSLVFLFSILTGLAIDAFTFSTLADLHAQHQTAGTWFQGIALTGIALLLIRSTLRQGPRGLLKQLTRTR